MRQLIRFSYGLFTTMFCLVAFSHTVYAQELPPLLRETAINDLNQRQTGLGRPLTWSYRIITADTSALGCEQAAPGAPLAGVQRVYIIDLEYPNATFTYHITEDAARLVPCTPGLLDPIPSSGFTILPPTPSFAADYAYAATTCADISGLAEPRLQIGEFGLVRTGDPVRLYENYAPPGPPIDTLPPLSVFFVLAGPECTVERDVWWQVEWQGTRGWLQESRLGGYYFADPVSSTALNVQIPPTPTPTSPPSPTPTATLTPSPTET
ncbi:MAG: hypothetical protein ACLFTK_02235, partial [Anaerolineales bacterium]